MSVRPFRVLECRAPEQAIGCCVPAGKGAASPDLCVGAIVRLRLTSEAAGKASRRIKSGVLGEGSKELSGVIRALPQEIGASNILVVELGTETEARIYANAGGKPAGRYLTIYESEIWLVQRQVGSEDTRPILDD